MTGMHWIRRTVTVIVLAHAGAAAAASFEVEARANSLTGGVALNTGLTFAAGDPLWIEADPSDLWNAGALPRWSNADGLVRDLFATGSDESGRPAGTKIGAVFPTFSRFGLTAPHGSLVAEIGGSYFIAGTHFAGPAPASGVLTLRYWDVNNFDNTDRVRVHVRQVPEPAAASLLLVGLGALIVHLLRGRFRGAGQGASAKPRGPSGKAR